MRPIARIAPDVGWLSISFVNVYFIGRPGSAWVLVDAGLPGFSREIIDAAEARFGSGRVLGCADPCAFSRNAIPEWAIAVSTP